MPSLSRLLVLKAVLHFWLCSLNVTGLAVGGDLVAGSCQGQAPARVMCVWDAAVSPPSAPPPASCTCLPEATFVAVRLQQADVPRA